MNHRRITALYVVATGLAVLAGCGDPQSASAIAPAPSPPPDISPKDMLENLLVSGNADWLLLSSMKGDASVFRAYFGSVRFSSSDGSCTMTTGAIVSAFQPTQEFEIDQTLTVTDFGVEGFFSDWATPAEDIEARTLQGMNLVQIEYSGDDTVGHFIGEGSFWSGWLEHQAFGAFSAEIATNTDERVLSRWASP
ncbi:MAG: hypothetical protein OXC19_17615 [Bryobacterales bacterium]|nr:hypothetical protein [Bryobacterales bacterium]